MCKVLWQQSCKIGFSNLFFTQKRFVRSWVFFMEKEEEVYWAQHLLNPKYFFMGVIKLLSFLHRWQVYWGLPKLTMAGIRLKWWISTMHAVWHFVCILDRFTWTVFSTKGLHREHLRGSAAGITSASGPFNAGKQYREALFLPVLPQRNFCTMVSHGWGIWSPFNEQNPRVEWLQ